MSVRPQRGAHPAAGSVPPSATNGDRVAGTVRDQGAVGEPEHRYGKQLWLAWPRQAGRLFQLAVFVAPAVEPAADRAAISRRLTLDAGPNPGQRTAARLRDFLTALQAVGLALTRRHTRAGPHDPIHDGIVDLILHRPVRSPATRHCRYPILLSSRSSKMGNRDAHSKQAM